MYKTEDVRAVCERFYGREISDRTWRKWRNHLGLGAESRGEGYSRKTELTARQACYLAAFAFTRKQRPQAKFLSLMQIIRELNSNPELNDQLMSASLMNNVKGDKLPQVITAFTGRKTSVRTLYRVAEKLNIEFSINNNYSKNEVEKFLAYFEAS